jgi:hypothetical protein
MSEYPVEEKLHPVNDHQCIGLRYSGVGKVSRSARELCGAAFFSVDFSERIEGPGGMASGTGAFYLADFWDGPLVASRPNTA